MTNVQDTKIWTTFEFSTTVDHGCAVDCFLYIISVVLIMDGLYRGFRTPKRSSSGPSLSPFSTSPHQLQEVTSSANATLFDQSKISPMRGRSVKEYDEQLTALKKENFNLKLRIYFLEERMGSTFRIEDKESILRKNIEYQVDIETLRKELDEKQDLLCQAVKALELEDNEHKRLLTQKDTQLTDFNERVVTLERELSDVRFANAALATNNEKLTADSNNLVEDALAFQRDHEHVRDEMDQLRKQLNELQCELTDEKEHNSLLEHDSRELECLQVRCDNMETELKEKTTRIEQLVTELETKGHMVSSCNLRIRTMEDAIVSSNSDIKFREKECLARDRVIQEQNLEIDNLRRAIEEAQSICDKEQRQVENLRAAVVARDNSIADLEGKFEKSKTVIRNLEAKMDSLMHENKRVRDELSAIKQRRVRSADFSCERLSPRSTHNTNSPRMLSPHQSLSSTDNQENNDQEELMQIEHKKACNVIKVLLDSKKVLEAENIKLKAELEAKSYPERRSNRTSSGRNSANSRENSVEDSDENKNFEDVSKCDMTTLEWTKQVEDLICVIEVKEEQLKSYKKQLEASCSIVQQKDNRITELENEVCLLKSELKVVNKKLDEIQVENPEKEKPVSWIRVTEEKDKKIEQLECEVRKQTFNLQGIVNKELWDKNREIEKQQNRFTDKMKAKEQEISVLVKQLTSKDMQLKMLKEKISELGIQVNLPCSLLATSMSQCVGDDNSPEVNLLKEKLKVSMEECKYLHKAVAELKQQLKNTPERDMSDVKFSQLREENLELKKEYEKSEKMRNETVNLCAILTNRLEELAYFLDSLLKHKSVLGVLGSKQRSAIKQAIDQSLDLSKSLSMSMMNDDHSLAQLSSITGLLNSTTQSSANNSSILLDLFASDNDHNLNGSLTYNSHLSKQRGDGGHNTNDQIISILRAQVETMKKEIEIRDNEIAKHNLSHQNDPESLKNDTDLVDAIINLTQNKSSPTVLSPGKIYQNLISNKSCPALLIKSQSPDHNSESEAWSEPDRGVSKARIGLDIEALNKSTSRSNNNRSVGSVEGATSESTEDEYIVNKKRRSSVENNVGILENKLKEKENEILTLKSDILILSNKSLELKLHMSEEVAKLRNEKLDIERILKETEEKFENVDLNNDEMLCKLQDLETQRDQIHLKLEESNEQVTKLKKQIVELEIIIEENEIYLHTKLNESEMEHKTHLDTLEKEKVELKIKYENDWIPKTEMFKQVTEMESMYHELDSIKELLKTSEDKIYTLEKSETELKIKLSDLEDTHREKIISLKRELNESTLRASQVALERTKVSNEKLKLEAEIRKLEMKECGKTNELEEKDKELNNLKNNLQKQIAQVEQQKSSLQLKVSELETANAELQNKLIKLQTSCNWSTGNGSPPKISDLVTNFKIFGKHSLAPVPRLSNYIRQRSDLSGYTSEDVLTDDNEPNNVFNHSAPSAFHWGQGGDTVLADDARVVTNSSPDLGIESDQGRFSSLETNIATTVVQRPLLQTLELTASMNNLLSANQLDNIGHYCNITAHKSLEKENGDLKKTVSKLETGLEKTVHELSKINRTKLQVEKAVCKQIHKTSKVLRQARANLDSGSEGEKRK